VPSLHTFPSTNKSAQDPSETRDPGLGSPYLRYTTASRRRAAASKGRIITWRDC